MEGETKVPDGASEDDVSQYPRYWLPGHVYDALKWAGLLLLPTLSWLYQMLAAVWGLPLATEVSTTLSIAGTLVGVLIGASQLKASASADAGGDD